MPPSADPEGLQQKSRRVHLVPENAPGSHAPAAALRLLKQYGVRQQDLAEKFNVSKAVISRWAHGTKPIPAYWLPDLWELADLVREAVATGRSVREVLQPWRPTLYAWRNARGEEKWVHWWELPSGPPTPALLPPDAFRGTRHASHWEDLQEVWDLLSTYLPSHLVAVAAGAPPTGDEVALLRRLFELGLTATSHLQEARARRPLPPNPAS